MNTNAQLDLFKTWALYSAAVLLMILGPVQAARAAGACVGTVEKVYVEANGDVYTYLSSSSCGCNIKPGGVFAFRTPVSQVNSKQTHSTVLAALLSGKQVSLWYDWFNPTACIAYNATIFK